MPFDVNFYLRVFFSRFPTFLAVFLLVIVGGFFAATALPKVYRSHAALLVESSQIPNDLAASTVRVDLSQQVQIIQQRMMARETLLDIADKLDLFRDETGLEPSQIVARLQKQIEMKMSGGRGAVTLLRITVSTGDAEVAARIADELVTRVLQQDADYRTEVASDTLSFFEKEVRRLGEELDYLNRRILEFQNENLEASPDTLDYRMNRLATLQERQVQTQRELKQAGEQRDRLKTLFQTTGRTNSLNQRPQTPEEEELAQVRSELREALGVFSESSPRVTVLKRRVEELEALVTGRAPDADIDAPGEAVFAAQMKEIDRQIAELQQTLESQNTEMASLSETIERTPAVSIRLDTLTRDRDNIQRQYDMAVERLSAAATGERIEVLSKGQRLSIVERPVVPTRPVNPSPEMIAAGSVLVGLLAGIAAVIVHELLQPVVRRSEDITRALNITPLAVLPYIDGPADIWRRRIIRSLAGLFIVMLGLAATYFFAPDLLPLDRLASVITDKAQP